MYNLPRTDLIDISGVCYSHLDKDGTLLQTPPFIPPRKPTPVPKPNPCPPNTANRRIRPAQSHRSPAFYRPSTLHITETSIQKVQSLKKKDEEV